MCRDFLDEPLPAAVLDPVLDAALAGPRAGNTHGLHLVVLRSESLVRYWDLTLPRPARDSFRWPGLLRAPVLVLIVVDPRAYVERYAAADKSHSGLGVDAADWPVPYWFVDGGAAVMGMLVAAEAAGVGALFFGQFAHEAAVAAEFGVPEGCRSVGTVALGWPAPDGRRPSTSATRGRPARATAVHLDQW